MDYGQWICMCCIMDGGCVCDGLWKCMWWNMDVYVIYPVLCVDIYVISLFVLMESKKQKNSIFSLFAECHTRQRGLCRVPWPWHSAKLGSRDPISQLCRVPEPWHSAKIFFKKKKFLCRVQEYGTRQRIFKKKYLCRVPLRWHSAKRPSELTSDFFYRVLTWHSAKTLSSARYVALGKETFADGFFADCSLPSAALGKLPVSSSESYPARMVNWTNWWWNFSFRKQKQKKLWSKKNHLTQMP